MGFAALYSSLDEPTHVQTLVAERDQHATSRRQTETGPETDQERVDRFLVKVGSAVAPALPHKALSRLVMRIPVQMT